jgi:uncharacterized membrane protein (UPF0127 family)
MSGIACSATVVETGAVIASNVTVAKSARHRLFGLMGRTRLELGSGLLLLPCNGIHTFGMRFPLDVLLLDRENRVLKIRRAMKPNRLLLPERGGFSTLELPAGAAQGVSTGSRLRFEPIDSAD